MPEGDGRRASRPGCLSWLAGNSCSRHALHACQAWAAASHGNHGKTAAAGNTPSCNACRYAPDALQHSTQASSTQQLSGGGQHGGAPNCLFSCCQSTVKLPDHLMLRPAAPLVIHMHKGALHILKGLQLQWSG